MDKSDIPFLSATELAGLIEKKDVSPVEAVEAYLDRIDQVDSKINSYITVCRDEALQAAREAEQAIIRGGYLGSMHGIPTAVKDQIYTKGIRTTGGSSILWDYVPDEDATVVAKLKEAGAILLGKLNLSEFAMGDSFYHPGGTPRNPWDTERNAGISSSGSAAATAAFLCATSLGEDTGGSTRIPAAWCGLVGLRPTWGRVSRYGVLPICWSMDIVGPISRTVEDCAITFKAIAGHDPKDAYSSETPVPDFRKALGGDIKGIKIGVIKEKVYSDDIHPEVRDALVKAIGELGELGASVEEVSLPLIEKSGAFSKTITDLEGASVHYENMKTRIKDYDHNSRVRLLTGILTPAQHYYKAQKLRAPPPPADHGAIREGGPVGAGLYTGPLAQAARRPRHQEPGGCRRPYLRREELHRTLQPGQHGGGCHTLRLHLGEPAHLPSDSVPPLRRGDDVQGCPRL